MKLIFDGEYVKNENGVPYEFDNVIKDNYKKQIKLIGGKSNGLAFISNNLNNFEVEGGEFIIESNTIEELKPEINNLKNLLYVSMFDSSNSNLEENHMINEEELIENFESLNSNLENEDLSIDDIN